MFTSLAVLPQPLALVLVFTRMCLPQGLGFLLLLVSHLFVILLLFLSKAHKTLFIRLQFVAAFEYKKLRLYDRG